VVEEGGVAVVGEFDLDLGPVGGAAVAGEAFGVDGVDADLGEEPAVAVEEVADVAVGAEPDEGVRARSRTRERTSRARASGRSSERGAWISSRTPGETGNLRCQPASEPPVRRRRVMEAAARRSSAVS